MTGLVLVTVLLVAGLLVVPVAGAVPSGYAAEPDPVTSRAGSRAGEGRERPGRHDAGSLEAEDEYAEDEGVEDEGDEADEGDAYADPGGPDAGIAPEPSQNAALPVPAAPPGPGAATTEEPVLQALALGTGLILMGLGLGLAFVGLRIRRE
ncbi:hypothetical protein [Streptomyces adelaidensis]|uniref:hypothetical protein n=1 Tax=Streptomyces adelaidensis TaxID=2796465 RepID=UPI0027DC6321|nr:hypothetical protein [Streptomyces adelaidensis]